MGKRTGQVLVSLVFPLADLRPLLAPDSTTPMTAIRERHANAYFRRFGPAKFRLSDHGLLVEGHEWFWRLPAALRANENWFISAKRFLHAPDQLIPPRLFSDGLLAARLEIILAPDRLSLKDGTKALRRLLAMEVEVRSSRRGKRTPDRETIKLDQVGKWLVQAYMAATTPEPWRAEARQGHDGAAAAMRYAAASKLVHARDPILIVFVPPRPEEERRVRLGVSTVRTEMGVFRVLLLAVNLSPWNEDPTARLARRSFVRLNCQAAAIQTLVSVWREWKQPPTLSDEKIDALGNLADSLHDSLQAIVDEENEPLPLLGEAAGGLSEAVNALGDLLDKTDPNAARRQRRLAKYLLASARPGAAANINLGTVGIMGSMSGGTIIQNIHTKGALK